MAPAVLPARGPPQLEMDLPPPKSMTDGWAIEYDQITGADDEWPDMDQTAGTGGDTWE